MYPPSHAPEPERAEGPHGIPALEFCEVVRARGKAPGAVVELALVWALPGQTIAEAVGKAVGFREFLGFVHGDRKARVYRQMLREVERGRLKVRWHAE